MDRPIETIRWYFECKDLLSAVFKRNMKNKKVLLPIILGKIKGDKVTDRVLRTNVDSYREVERTLNNAEAELKEATQQADEAGNLCDNCLKVYIAKFNTP